MKYFRRGRHRTTRFSVRVHDLTPSFVPGVLFEATYTPVDHWRRLVGRPA